MIHATEALTLPTAKLTEDEIAAANMLEAEIEAHIRKYMERRGVDFETKETRPNVVSEVNQRLKSAGFNPTWFKKEQPNRFRNVMEVVGYFITIAPTDDSYAANRNGASRLLSA